MGEIITLIVLTLTPFLELRASIPYAVLKTDLSLLTIFFIAVVTNILLAGVVFIFLDKIMHIFLHIKSVERMYHKTLERTQKKVHKYVERYGVLGLALFIGVPLPGSGVYSGALGAYFLGFSFRDFFRAAVVGVLIAGVIVMVVSVFGNGAWHFLLKT